MASQTWDLVRRLVAKQFLEFSNLTIADIEKQNHDYRTYRLGNDMTILMSTATDYALNFTKELRSTAAIGFLALANWILYALFTSSTKTSSTLIILFCLTYNDLTSFLQYRF